jgi:DNA-directed RNA polymerase specialized sigma24 family protein
VTTTEDVVQECWVAVLQHERGSVRAYLFGIERNLAFERLRISKRELDRLRLRSIRESMQHTARGDTHVEITGPGEHQAVKARTLEATIPNAIGCDQKFT